MPGFAVAKSVNRYRRSTGIKIIPVGRQRLGGFGVDQLAEMTHLVRPLQTRRIARQPLHQVTFPLAQTVDLFRPDPEQLAQRAREAARKAEIGFIHNAAPVGRDQMPPLGHKGFGAFGESLADHVEHRGNHQRVLAQRLIGIDHVNGNAFLPEGTVVLIHGFFVLQAHIARACGIVHRPAALLVKDNGHPRLGAATRHHRQTRQHIAQLAHLTPDAGIQMPHMVDNCPVELLYRAAAFTPLEILHRIRPVSHRL